MEQRQRRVANDLSALAYDGFARMVELVNADNPRHAQFIPLDVRQKYLALLLPYYDRVAGLKGDDETTRAAKAKVLISRAKLYRLRGETHDDAAAVEDLEQALALYQSLSPSNEARIGMAGAVIAQVAFLGPQRRFAEGIALLDQALPPLVTLVNAEPDQSEARFLLSRGLSNRANCRRALGQLAFAEGRKDEAATHLAESERDFRLAVEQMDILNRQVPGEPRYLKWTSGLLGNLGLLQLDQAQLGQTDRLAACRSNARSGR